MIRTAANRNDFGTVRAYGGPRSGLAWGDHSAGHGTRTGGKRRTHVHSQIAGPARGASRSPGADRHARTGEHAGDRSAPRRAGRPRRSSWPIRPSAIRWPSAPVRSRISRCTTSAPITATATAARPARRAPRSGRSPAPAEQRQERRMARHHHQRQAGRRSWREPGPARPRFRKGVGWQVTYAGHPLYLFDQQPGAVTGEGWFEPGLPPWHGIWWLMSPAVSRCRGREP